jgi:hypothetical protein
MATRTITEFIDDLTGEAGEDVKTVEFSLDGSTYEIDLAGDNAARFRDNLSPYIKVGRKSLGKAAKASSVRIGAGLVKRDRAQTKAIRDWARTNGYQISDRGRIPTQVEHAYNSNDPSLLNISTPVLAPVG